MNIWEAEGRGPQGADEVSDWIIQQNTQRNPGTTWAKRPSGSGRGWIIYRVDQSAESQQATKPNQFANRLDLIPGNNKNPKSDLDAEQRIATAGETVPIVFGKRVSDNGGVWVQPSLLKAGSYFFKGSFLYAISQGEVASSPVKHRVWAGLRNLAFLADQTVTVSSIYNTAATLDASPGTCPVIGDGMFCGDETYSYIAGAVGSGEWVERQDYVTTSYYGVRTIARGTGDTTNSTIEATLQVFDNNTGNNLTVAYFAAIGLPTNTVFRTNYSVDFLSGASATGCGAVDVVQDIVGTLGYVSPDPAFYAGIGATGGITNVYNVTGVNDQTFGSVPASTGTLDAVQFEYIVSPYADPTSTPTANNRAYRNITFLKVVGDIYERQASGSYPTTPKQLSAYYEQGVNVDLYSGGLVSGSYAEGPSNQLVDLAMYMFTIYNRRSKTDPDLASPINVDNMPSIAAFCDAYTMHFNGVISESVNIIEFISLTAPYFLLSFQSAGGQYEFQPLLPVDGSNEIDTTALTPAATFTEDDILPGTFSKTYVPASDKENVIAAVMYRSNDPSEIGRQQTVEVRYQNVSLNAPIEQFDMTSFCSSRDHAILYAKHFLARRRHSTHAISFAIPLSTAGLKPTDVFKLERQRINSAGDDRTETEWYQITTISHSTDGTSGIEASRFPVNNNDIAIISNQIVNATFSIV